MKKEQKVFYGLAFENDIDLRENDNKNKMELEYYRIESKSYSGFLQEPKTIYGIEIVKKEYTYDDKVVESEKSAIKEISTNPKKVEEMLCMLKENKATPIILEDVIKDLSLILP